MRRRQALIIACSLAAIAGTASWLQLPVPSQAFDSAAPRPVIGRIVGRNHLITITAGDDQPRYSVHRDGQSVADGVTLDQLEQIDPESHRQINSATTASGSPTIWAGLEIAGE